MRTPDQPQPFGRLLRTLREGAGLSVAELARRAGLKLGTVWKLEDSPDTVPSWPTVQALAAALGVPTDRLRTEAPPPEPEPARPRGRPKRG